ncbi:hypothetical protein OIU74_003357 [Salix koriyanagi]|uniref:Uncharacterized protein n=1 Tax=Salix koriyanagi TaxID=2511006 RepID=A0A9Q0UZ75_9ROSI|nr:hypothetical protein OIU74_003357 [Salix koriyanagi]
MESTTLLVLSYLFKVFVFTKPSLAADEVAVLDIVGEELKADTEYYILPVLRWRWRRAYNDQHWVSAETSSSTYNHTSCHRQEWCDPCSTDLNIKFSAESKV